MMARGLALLVLASAWLPAADRSLTGKVVDADTGQPIARAHVTMRFVQGGMQGAQLAVLSDADGSFQVTNLPEGPYQLLCDKAGYVQNNQGVPFNAQGNSVAPVILKLTAQATLDGTVIDGGDSPALWCRVQLVRQDIINGRRQFQVAGGASTDETGAFRLFGLRAGRYYLSISPQISGALRKNAAYAPLYYPKASDLAGAQPIDLKAGDSQQIRIRLPEPIVAHEIQGEIVTAASNFNVTLTRQPAAQYPITEAVENHLDAKTKTFRISRVTPGTYLLTARAQEVGNNLQTSTTVTVGNADIKGLRLEPIAMTLDGTLRAEETALPARGIFVSFQSGRFGTGGPVDADGKFHVVSMQPDTYQVSAQGSGALCIRSVQQGGRDVRDALVIAADSSPAPVDIVLTGHCGSIQGTVTISDSTPGNLNAVLLRKAGNDFVAERQWGMVPQNNSNSLKFQFTNLTPGEYTIYVWPQDAQIEYDNAEYMRPFESYGQRVTVQEDVKATVTVDKILLPGKN